jgi:hypothetical protein
MEGPRAPSINRRSRSSHRFRESAERWAPPRSPGGLGRSAVRCAPVRAQSRPLLRRRQLSPARRSTATRHASEGTRRSGWRSSPARGSPVYRKSEDRSPPRAQRVTMQRADLTTRRRSRPSRAPRSSSRAVDLAVGPFVGPNQAVLGRIGTRRARARPPPIATERAPEAAIGHRNASQCPNRRETNAICEHRAWADGPREHAELQGFRPC